MPLEVRPVNLDSDRTELLKILERNLQDVAHARRFDWLYLNNPAGRAWSWFVVDGGSGAPIGIASLYPRAVWSGGKILLCGQVGDFAVDAKYRSLGPALMLQRATFDPVDRGALAFCYDCPPHDAGMAPFRRLGLDASCRMTRHARLIRTDRFLSKRLGANPLSRCIAAAGNIALRAMSRTGRKPAGVEIAPLAGRFGEEFSGLDAELGRDGAIRYRRRAEDLNWRYLDDPIHKYGILVARAQGRLIGYAVYAIAGGNAGVIDLFGNLTPEISRGLLDAVAEEVRREPVETLNFLLSDDHRLLGDLRRAGFRIREKAALIVPYAAANAGFSSGIKPGPGWQFQHGDILA